MHTYIHMYTHTHTLSLSLSLSLSPTCMHPAAVLLPAILTLTWSGNLLIRFCEHLLQVLVSLTVIQNGQNWVLHEFDEILSTPHWVGH